MNIADIIGLVAGVFTTTAFLPQVVKTLKTKSTKDISLGMFLTTTTGLVLWLIYGLLAGAIPVIVANSISLPLCLTIVFCKFKYR